MLRKLSIGLLLALPTLASCVLGSARVISRTQAGGVIELNGDRNKAMEQAHGDMSSHCGPGNYTIVKEGEEVVGTDTVAQEDTSYGESRGRRRTHGGSTTTAQTQTRAATEWRVHYACGGAAAAPAGGPPPGAGGPPPGEGGPPPGDPNAGPPPPGY